MKISRENDDVTAGGSTAVQAEKPVMFGINTMPSHMEKCYVVPSRDIANKMHELLVNNCVATNDNEVLTEDQVAELRKRTNCIVLSATVDRRPWLHQCAEVALRAGVTVKALIITQ